MLQRHCYWPKRSIAAFFAQERLACAIDCSMLQTIVGGVARPVDWINGPETGRLGRLYEEIRL
jgi:hypothetical protein